MTKSMSHTNPPKTTENSPLPAEAKRRIGKSPIHVPAWFFAMLMMVCFVAVLVAGALFIANI